VVTSIETEKALETKTILNLLQNAKDPETGEKLDIDDLMVNSSTIVYLYPLVLNVVVAHFCSGAAATTTTVALTFTLYYILSIPRVWDRLSREIRSTFRTVEEINEQSISNLVFLDAVIREGLLSF